MSDEEHVQLTGEAWAVVARHELTDEARNGIVTGLRKWVPDKRFIVFGVPVDLVPLTSLDAAWAIAVAALPVGWGLSVAAEGPGYVARALGPDHGPDLSVTAWSQADPELPNYDPIASPARALQALAQRLAATEKSSPTTPAATEETPE